MKLLLSFFLTTILTLLSIMSFAQQLDEDGTRNYMLEDWSNGTTYLEKFKQENRDQWQHALARIDGFMFRRNSVPGLNELHTAQNQFWDDFQETVSNSVWYAGMNSGLMNKSWEYADRSKWSGRFKGDLGIIEICRDAGFEKIVMYMQSPLSKGQKPTYDTTVKNTSQPNGGATLEMRVDDCLEYAQYIEANRVSGIDVTYALIDAFPQKNSFGDRSVYRAAFKDLVETFRDAGLTFEGIIFDGKTDWVKNNGAQILVNDCKYVEETIASQTGVTLYAGWYTWNKVSSPEQGDAAYMAAMNKLLTITDNEYMSHYWIAGNKEQGYFPDYINGTPSTRTERVNQAFCTFEGFADNPTQAGDPILGPVNSADVPPSEINNFNIEINTINQLTLTWDNTYREDTFKIKRFDHGIKTDTIDVDFTLKDVTSYVDNTIEPDSTYTYFISAENEFGRTFSKEIEVTITTYAPAEATDLSTDTSDCYQIVVKWTDNADNENKYLLIRKEQGISNDSVVKVVPMDSTTYTDNAITVGKVYSYKIAALNHVDTTFSVWKEANNSSCTSSPLTPDSLKAVSNECKLTDFTWYEDAINEIGVELQLKIKDGNWESYYLSKNSNSSSIKLEFDTSYSARIRTFNEVDTSDWSDTTDFTTLLCDCDRSTYGNEGAPWKVGQYVQVEHFDQCTNGRIGQYITYYEPDTENHGTIAGFRENELIDLFNTTTTSDGDQIVRTGAIHPGEYLEFTFDIETAGTYELQARVGSKWVDTLRTIYVYSNDELVTTFNYYGTDDVNWKRYLHRFSDDFDLYAGEQIIRLESAGGTDMDWFRIVPEGSSSTENFLSYKVNLYPNPANDYLYIQLGDQDHAIISIYTMNGKLMGTIPANSNVFELNTSNYETGLYLIRVSANNTTSYHKVLIQR